VVFSGKDFIVFGEETRIFFFTFIFFSGIKYHNLIPEKGCFLLNKEEIFRPSSIIILLNDQRFGGMSYGNYDSGINWRKK
jgi:hypothetical protein